MGESLGWDELFMRTWVHDRSLGETYDRVQSLEKTPPFGFLLAWLVDRLASAPEVIRIPSFLAGVSLIPLTAALALRVWRKSAAIAAAAVVAASPFLVFHSIEARSYSVVAAFSLCSTLALLRARATPSFWNWCAYSVFAALALSTHYIAAAILGVQLVWALSSTPRARSAILLAQVPSVVTLAAISPLVVSQFSHAGEYLKRMDVVAPLTLETVARINLQSLIGQPFAYLDQVPGWVGIGLIVIGVSLALSGALRGKGSTGPRLSELLGSEQGLIGILALATPLLLIGVSLIPQQSVLMARNLIPSVPYSLALVGVLLTAAPGWKRAVPTVLVVGGLCVGTWESATEYQRPQFKAAAQAVMETWRPGQPIVEVCCLPGQEGLPGVVVATYLPKRASFANFHVLTNGGAQAIERARREGIPFYLIWRDGNRGRGPSPLSKLAPGSKTVWEAKWPGLFWVGAGEYR